MSDNQSSFNQSSFNQSTYHEYDVHHPLIVIVGNKLIKYCQEHKLFIMRREIINHFDRAGIWPESFPTDGTNSIDKEFSKLMKLIQNYLETKSFKLQNVASKKRPQYRLTSVTVSNISNLLLNSKEIRTYSKRVLKSLIRISQRQYDENTLKLSDEELEQMQENLVIQMTRFSEDIERMWNNKLKGDQHISLRNGLSDLESDREEVKLGAIYYNKYTH